MPNVFINIMDFHDPGDGADLTNTLETLIYAAFPSLGALQIFIPEGDYVVSRQIIPARQVTIRGAGMFATVLNFHDVASINAVMKGAISFGLKSTVEEYEADTYGEELEKVVAWDGNRNGSDFSIVEDLTIQISGSRPAGFDYGLWSAARLVARNVTLQSCGAKLEAGNRISTSGTVVGNANLSELSNCHSLYATAHGFMLDGSDVNACKILGCNAFVPTEYGFYEAGFLGNTYLGCHVAGGTTAPRGYVVASPPGANRSNLVGCYAEADFANSAWDVQLPAVIIAPQGELPAPSWNKNAVLAGGGGSGFVIADQLNFVADLNGYEMGDASTPGLRIIPGAMFIRGDGDRHEYFIARKDVLGMAGGAGISVIKRLYGTDTKYELVDYGDTRHRPAFPRGLIATLPTHANNSAATGGGLTAGEVYKTSTGEVRIVV